MKPLPEPWRGGRGRAGRRADRRRRAGTAATTLRPLRLRRRVDVHDGGVDALGDVGEVDHAGRSRATPAAAGRVAAPRARARSTRQASAHTPPARMTPTRNATEADSASVMKVKRFDMDENQPQLPAPYDSSIIARNASSVRVLTPRVVAFSSLLPGVGADDQICRFSADRARDFAPQPFDGRRRLVPAHRRAGCR